MSDEPAGGTTTQERPADATPPTGTADTQASDGGGAPPERGLRRDGGGRRRSRILRAPLSRTGLVLGALYFAASLSPSLLPRAAWSQGVLSGITLVIGYGIGAGLAALYRYLQVPSLPRGLQRVVSGVFLTLVAVLIGWSVWSYVGWQNDLRGIFGMPSISPTGWPVLVVVTLAVAGLLLLIARALRSLFRFVMSLLNRWLPLRLANVLGVLVVLVVLGLLYSGVLVRGFWAGTSAIFAPQNGIDKAGVTGPPSSALRSGGPGSTVTWESLGREGRAFVTLGPTTSELTAAAPGTPVKEPIRVYAGLESAESIQGRADIVLRELQRTGAFDRKVLVLATTTGSGFIQPGGIDPVEYLWHGDTAVAGVQYSYLPSWLSLLADQANVQSASQTVFRTVYSYWQTLPEASRPKIYVYGLSLGSYGVQSVLTNIELLNAPIDGALMVGPPFVNPLHKQLTAGREPGSPVWQPVYENGRTVRFTAREPVLETNPGGPWGPVRIAYIQHGSDPVVNFSPNLLLDEPEWLLPGQRPPDVSPLFRWYRVVTMWQVLFDLPAAGGVPPGLGHMYSATENTYGWAAVSQPPGWSQAELDRLATDLGAKLGAG
jgi:uncharacterized membrane protein